METRSEEFGLSLISEMILITGEKYISFCIDYSVSVLQIAHTYTFLRLAIFLKKVFSFFLVYL